MLLPPVPCGLSASCPSLCRVERTHVAAGEVTTLEHELGDHAVELRALVSKTLLARAESAEVLGRLGHDIVEEVEVDAAGLLWRAYDQYREAGVW
jgi:hypothetical protein